MSQVISLFKEDVTAQEQLTGEVCFENDGEIDIRSVTTFGVSSKPEGSIGFFGTGLKYAIAILLRENLSITIYSGLEKFEFSKKTMSLRDKEFEQCYVNDRELSFTTELGKTWELWKAYRELFCNMKDEGGRLSPNVFSHVPEAGKTRIYVGGIGAVHSASEEFLLKTEPIYCFEEVEVHPKTGDGGIFYKGVKVHTTKKYCQFNYNITAKIDLTEDRTAKYEWQVVNKIRDSIMSCCEHSFLQKVLSSPVGTFEETLAYDESYSIPSEEFIKVAALLGERATKAVRQTYRKHAMRKGIVESVPLTKVQESQLKRAKEFCALIGWKEKYPVIVTDQLNEGILGMAEGTTIYLSTQAFRSGTKIVAATLWEEFIHLEKGFADESRDMQNFLFDTIMTLLEEKKGEAI